MQDVHQSWLWGLLSTLAQFLAATVGGFRGFLEEGSGGNDLLVLDGYMGTFQTLSDFSWAAGCLLLGGVLAGLSGLGGRLLFGRDGRMLAAGACRLLRHCVFGIVLIVCVWLVVGGMQNEDCRMYDEGRMRRQEMQRGFKSFV